MKIGIICAIPNEIRHFPLKTQTGIKIGGKTFFEVEHSQHELVVVECGVGKVNAAMVSTLLIHEFACQMILFSGVAGGLDPEIQIGEVMIGDSLIQNDYGALIDGKMHVYRAGAIPMGKPVDGIDFKLDDEIKTRLKENIPALRMGTILTSDIFLQCSETRKELFEKFGAQAIEMEGAAVAQVAKPFGIPVIVVRCMSDLAGANGEKINRDFIKKSAEAAYQTVMKILQFV